MNKGLLAYPQPSRYTESYNTNYERAPLARYLVTSTNTDYVEFDYTYSGEKIRKRSFGTGEAQRLYLGGVEFLGEEAESYYFSEGRVGLDTLNFQYKLTDHLGNTVVLFEDRDGDGDLLTELDTQDSSLVEVLQRHYYYPFGMPMQGTWQDTTAPRMDYLYNGKEVEEELGLGWLAYGARYYDAVVGRFTGVDPLAHKYPSISSYAYVANNPINMIDPDGRYIVPASFAQKYKMITSYLQKHVANDVMNSPTILNAFASNTAADNPDGIGNLSVGLAPY